MTDKIFCVNSHNEHTMGDSLYDYIDIKVHPYIKNNNYNKIIIRGKYNREKEIISNKEKNDKMFNWKRPTVEVDKNDNSILYINCFPELDYIKHYSSIIKTYYEINKFKKKPLIENIIPTNLEIQKTLLQNTNIKDVPDGDIFILGIVHHFFDKNLFYGNGDFRWIKQKINNKNVVYLGCNFSIWGDIAGQVVEILANKNANQIIYIGKLGTLNKNHTPNSSLATGNKSLIDNKILEWKNIFDDIFLDNLYIGIHNTLYSVIEETKTWFEKNKKYDFVDPEIGRIAFSCIKKKIDFSYLHIISDNLNKNHCEDLSNERNSCIVLKRFDLYEQIKAILHSKELFN